MTALPKGPDPFKAETQGTIPDQIVYAMAMQGYHRAELVSCCKEAPPLNYLIDFYAGKLTDWCSREREAIRGEWQKGGS